MFKDELMILGKKLTESELKIQQLEAENQNLKTEREELIKKIQIYDQKINPFFTQTSSGYPMTLIRIALPAMGLKTNWFI